ncbi:MAG TPA: prepilin-type N-terminal cleavage/methylation domain-containing protein [Candidatus Sulfotelmatobacter sp.]|nr:prepilin-type N-terminal cleavage/methylation domain-containing protein [Candidatus Sulfotelmatobacter sp.]
MRSTRGFSLIELLIVVAIILVIAAIAIPSLLQAKIAANEASAAASLNAIKSAEVTYYTAYPTIGYAADIKSLGGAAPCAPSSTSACLIDSLLSSSIPGSTGKSGYVYLATGIMTAGATINTAFVGAAAPMTVHSSGNHDFCTTNDGILRSKMSVVGDLPVNDLASCIAFPVAQ